MGIETSKETSHTDPLMKAISAGHAAVFVTGNIHDFTLVGDEIAYRLELIMDQLYEQGFIVIRYSKSQGGRIHRYSSLNPKDKQVIDSRLNAVGLLPILNKDGNNTPEETRNFFRSVSR
ncbi:MAG: hypothetical protein AAB116_07390, partial [Candidatus Poribacteria bacterium]